MTKWGNCPLETQVKLLRVLQEREFEPVGSNRSVRVDVRIIAATNRNLEESISAGSFRSDLYYRLNVFPLAVPRCASVRSDIPQLAMFFLSRYSRALGKRIEGISAAATERLEELLLARQRSRVAKCHRAGADSFSRPNTRLGKRSNQPLSLRSSSRSRQK